MKKMVFVYVTILFLGMFSVICNQVHAAEQEWNKDFPEGYKWKNPPLTFKFINGNNHPCRAWTEAEKKVARAAIQEWNASILCYLHNNITEQTDCTKAADITLRWEDEDFFKDWSPASTGDLRGKYGYWYYGQKPPQGGPPQADFPLQEIYLNAKVPMGWYVDDTPGNDNDDFNKKREQRPGDPPNTDYPDTWREADPENPAVDPKTGKGNPVFDYTIEWKCKDCGETGKSPKLR